MAGRPQPSEISSNWGNWESTSDTFSVPKWSVGPLQQRMMGLFPQHDGLGSMVGGVILVVVLVVVATMVMCHYKPQWCPSCITTLTKKGTNVVTKGRSWIDGQSGGADGTGGTSGGPGCAATAPTVRLDSIATQATPNSSEPYTIDANGLFAPKPHTVMVVYADWCGYSDRFIKGHFATFEENHRNDSLGLLKVEVGNTALYNAVETYLENNDEKVEGFPTIFYNTPNNTLIRNTIGRTPESLEKFVSQNS